MVKEIKGISEDTLILIFTSYKENIALQYIEEGANGFLNKQSDPKNFVKVVEALFKDGHYYTLEIMNELLKGNKKRKAIENLSERELQVLIFWQKEMETLRLQMLLTLRSLP